MTKTLEKYRKQLDAIDNVAIGLLSERFKITRKIGKFKKENKIPTLDKKREENIYKNLEKKATQFNIDVNMVKDIWKVIMIQSKKEQE